jgi:DNA polymerase III gamma/tau subunit
MLSKSAFNALLKTLEEPPPHVKFILATTEAEKVLPTILSRCQRYDFRNIATKEIAEHLAEVCKNEKIKADEDALLLIAKAGCGSMRDALSLLDRLLSVGEKKLTAEMIEQLLGLPKSQVIFDLVQSIGEGKTKQVLEASDKLIQGGLSAESLVAALIDHLRDLLILRTCGPESRLVEVPGVAMADLQKQAQQFDAVALAQDIPILEELRRNLRSAQAGRALLDATLVRLALADQFSSIGELLGRVDGATTSAGASVQKKKFEPVAVAPAPASIPMAAASRAADPGIVIQVDEEESDDDLPRPGKVWEGPSLAEALKQQAALSNTASASPGPDLSNIEPIPTDLATKWNELLQRLQSSPGVHGVFSQATLVGLDGNNNAIISLSSKLETFVRGFERNGKKELVRAAISETFGEGIGYKFQIEAAPEAATATATAAPQAHPQQAPARPVMRTVEAPAPMPAPAPSIRITPELEQSLMEQDPLIKAAVEQLGAKIVKVTDE